MRASGTTRRTPQADAVRQVLVDSDGFRSAQDVYALLRGGGQSIGLSTVYRRLQALADEGVADVIVTPEGETTYRYCQAQGTHHHHLVCRRCGHAEEVAGPAVERWAAKLAAEHGYTDVEHTLEVFGVCAACSGQA